MRRLRLASCAWLAAAGLVASIVPSRAGSAGSHAGGYAIEATVVPASDQAGAFVCTTVLREASSHRVIASPKMRFLRGGKPARLHLAGFAPDTVLEVTVGVSSENEARYAARFIESGETRLLQAVVFALGSDAQADAVER
jgi:hypothetical protein